MQCSILTNLCGEEEGGELTPTMEHYWHFASLHFPHRGIATLAFNSNVSRFGEKGTQHVKMAFRLKHFVI